MKAEGFKGGTSKKISFVSTQQKTTNQVVCKVQGLLSPSMTVEVAKGLPSNTKPGNRDMRVVQDILPALERRGIQIKKAGSSVANQNRNVGHTQKMDYRKTTDKLPSIPNAMNNNNRLPQMSSPPMSSPPRAPVMGIGARHSQISDEDIVKNVVLKSPKKQNSIPQK